MSQAVIVVPMLAPMINPIAASNESNPALTRLTIMTVVAEEDCIDAVIRNPVVILRNLLKVTVARIFLIPVPATF